MAKGLVSFTILLSFLAVLKVEAVSYIVGDATGWTVPSYDDFYDDWENNKIFRVGDQLIFNWTGVQNVVKVTEQQYDSCANVTDGLMTTSPAIYNLTTIGDHYFISTIANQCLRGQKLSVDVDPALLTSPPPPPPPTSGPSAPPTTPTVPTAPATGVNHTVGDATGWTVPPNDDFYDDWDNNKIFRVGDRLIFNWTGVQNVVEVTEQQYDSCTNVTIGVITTSPAVITLTRIGDHYFICTIANQCQRGQKLSIDVDPALPSSPPPPPSMSPPPPPPSSTTAPAPSPPPSTGPTTSPPPSTGATTSPPPSTEAATSPPPSTGTGATSSPPPSSGSASFGPIAALSAVLPALVLFV